MARRSLDYPLHTKSARAKLAPRKKPYCRQIAPGRLLGYYRKESGSGSWAILQYVAGRYRQTTIGTADDIAKADAVEVLSFEQAQQRAIRPAEQTDNAKTTIRQACERYLIGLAARSKHAKGQGQSLAKHVYPVLGDLSIVRAKKHDFERWQTGMVKTDGTDEQRRRSQDTCNRVWTSLKAALNSSGLPDAEWRRVKPFRAVDAPRPDHFTPGEVAKLIACADTFDKAFARLLEVGFLTGARLGELVNANVGDFSAARGALSVSGKTGKRAITLTSECTALLRNLTRDKLPTAPLLPNADGSRWNKSEQHRPMKRAVRAAELPASASFYSLRHSHLTHSIVSGVPLPVIAGNTGTSLRMLERHYYHVMQDTHRALIEQHAPKLRAVQ